MEVLKSFIFAGISPMTATSVIQPIDTIKVRIQIASESKINTNFFVIAKNIFLLDGIKGFYKGLGSAILRQATYGTARIGFYKHFFSILEKKNKDGKVSFKEKILCSVSSASLGICIGNPFDVALVRFQTDSLLPKEKRRNYNNTFNAISRICKEENVLVLWKGLTPNIFRAIAMNCGQLVTFDEVKEKCIQIRKKEDNVNRLIASAAAGLMSSILALPLDNAKTKLQKMVKLENGKYEYNGFFDCLYKSIKREGFLKLWIGFPAFYLRVAPHAMITLLLNEYLTIRFKK